MKLFGNKKNNQSCRMSNPSKSLIKQRSVQNAGNFCFNINTQTEVDRRESLSHCAKGLLTFAPFFFSPSDCCCINLIIFFTVIKSQMLNNVCGIAT